MFLNFKGVSSKIWVGRERRRGKKGPRCQTAVNYGTYAVSSGRGR